MNFVLGVALLIAACIISGMLASRYRNEKVFLNDFLSFLDSFEANVRFAKSSVAELVESSKTKYHNQFRDVLEGKIQCDKLNILPELCGRVQDFFHSIGRYDSATQLLQITQTRKLLEDVSEKVKLNDKKSELTIRLGVMCGLSLLIIVL